MIAHRFFGAYRDAYTGLSSDLWLLALVAVGAAINAAIIYFVSRWLVGLLAR